MLPFQLIFKNKLRESKCVFFLYVPLFARLIQIVLTIHCQKWNRELEIFLSFKSMPWIILARYEPHCFELWYLKCKFTFGQTQEALLLMIFGEIVNYHKNEAVPFGHYVLGVGDSLMTSCAGWLFGSCNLIFYSWLVLKSTE